MEQQLQIPVYFNDGSSGLMLSVGSLDDKGVFQRADVGDKGAKGDIAEVWTDRVGGQIQRVRLTDIHPGGYGYGYWDDIA